VLVAEVNAFKLEIYTPYRLFHSDEVQALVLKISDGEIGVYAGHSLFTAPIVTCAARIRDKSGAWKSAFLANGIIEVKKTKTVLLVNAANWPDEIDVERAQAAKAGAESVLETSSFKFERTAAKEKLIRAETRLQVGADGGGNN
jgi:F-type H+-transporting ATPase subunit epsilon